MNTTPNYEFNVCVGDDLVNSLVQNFPNWTNLDTILRNVENKGIGTATELKTGTVHALTRDDTNIPFIRFQATSRFDSNDSFTVDGLSVSALDVSGQALADGAFVIGAMVLCELRDTVLTVYVSGSANAQTLDGHPASYFGTKTEVDAVDDKADANYTLIGNLQSQIDGITTQLSNILPNNFSTNEIKIGKYGNDDVYRKVIIATSNGIVDPVLTTSYVKDLLRLDGSFLMDNSKKRPLPWIVSASEQIVTELTSSGLSYNASFSGHTVNYSVIVVEYTKN